MQRHTTPTTLKNVQKRQKRARSGFTLLEVVAAMSVMLTAMLALTSTSLVTHTIKEVDRERRLAINGLMGAMSRLQARAGALVDAETGWSTNVLAAYEPGGTPGPRFEIQGLEPWDAETAVGSITIVTDETVSGLDLDVDMGMPRDLDGDGFGLTTDVTDTAILLPVVLRVRWQGKSGNQEIVQGTWIARM